MNRDGIRIEGSSRLFFIDKVLGVVVVKCCTFYCCVYVHYCVCLCYNAATAAAGLLLIDILQGSGLTDRQLCFLFLCMVSSQCALQRTCIVASSTTS